MFHALMGPPHPCAFPVDPTSLHISSGSPHPCTSLVDPHINAHFCWIPTLMYISSVCPHTCTSLALTGLSRLLKNTQIWEGLSLGGDMERVGGENGGVDMIIFCCIYVWHSQN